MASKARMSRGSKEAKQWNLKMQQAKRKKKEMREKKKKTSPVRKSKKKTSAKKKRVRFSKRLEQPDSEGTIDPNTFRNNKIFIL